MTATTSWTSNSSQSIPLVAVEMPTARARKVPMTAATMPTTIVSQIGMFCRPGRMSRARAPMMAPMTIADDDSDDGHVFLDSCRGRRAIARV